MSDFDPYHKWLGIRDSQRPPNHYRLLGLELFEDDRDVISMAADRQMSHVKTFQTGPNGEVSQRLLSELADARRCLLNQETKNAYDQGLQAAQTNFARPTRPYDDHDMLPPGAAASSSVPMAIPSDGDELTGYSEDAIAESSDDPMPFEIKTTYDPVSLGSKNSNDKISVGNDSGARRRRTNRPGMLPQIIGVIGGGLLAVIVSAFIINSGFLDRFRNAAENGPELVDRDNPNTDKSRSKTETKSPLKNSRDDDDSNTNSRRKNQPKPGSDRKPLKTNPPGNKSNKTRNKVASSKAPWNENRFPKIPDNWINPRSERDKVLRGMRALIAKRRFREANNELQRIKPQLVRLNDRTNWDKLIIDLEKFWNHVLEEARRVPLGTQLRFRTKQVTVAARRTNTLILKFGNEQREFRTTIQNLDRDVAQGLAMHANKFDHRDILKWLSWDFNHVRIARPKNSVTTPNTTPDKPNRPKSPDKNTKRLAGPTGKQPGKIKSPVPDRSKTLTAKKTVQRTFPLAYDRGTSANDRINVVASMIRIADDAKDSAEKYVTLTEAIRISSEMGNTRLTAEGLTKLRDHFELTDYWNVATKYWDEVSKKLRDRQEAKSLFDQLIKDSELAFTEQEVDVAVEFAERAGKLARKVNDIGSLDNANNHKKYYREVAKLVDRGTAALKSGVENLKGDEKLHAGKYLFFVKKDYRQGAELLSQSSDPKWANVGKLEQELSNESDPGKSKLLGDQWFAIGQKAKDFTEKSALLRAKIWYEKSLRASQGLQRQLNEKRLQVIDSLIGNQKLLPYLPD